MDPLTKQTLDALRALVAHAEGTNRAFYVAGTAKAMKAAMQGQRDVLAKGRAAIAQLEAFDVDDSEEIPCLPDCEMIPVNV